MHVHLHAVDHGLEILAPQRRMSFTALTRLRERVTALPIDRVDVGAPQLELLDALVARPGRVRDVVDLAAERIDLVHRLALRLRHDAHRGVERAAGGAFGGGILGFDGGHVYSRISFANAGACGPRPTDPAQRRDHDARQPIQRELRLAQVHPLAQRIARLQQRDDAARIAVDHRDFEREPRVLDLAGERLALAEQASRCAPRESWMQRSSSGDARSAPSSPGAAPAAANASSGM